MPSRKELENREKKLALERFRKERGFIREWHELMVEYDKDFFEIFIDWSSHMYKKGPLPVKVKELILVAIDVVKAYEQGVRLHIKNALEAGATKEEIVEVLELCTLIGAHSCPIGLPILNDELKKHKHTHKTRA